VKLLRHYIRVLLENAPNPRIPTQLMSPNDANDDDPSIDSKRDDRLDDDELTTQGFSGPLGVDRDDMLSPSTKSLEETELDEFSSVGGGAMSGGSIMGTFTGVPDSRAKKKKK
jgi:hypothetical protein